MALPMQRLLVKNFLVGRIRYFSFAALVACLTVEKSFSSDTRILVELPQMMQQHMMSNMRDHLAAINEILVFLGKGELEKAAETAEFRL